MAYTSVCKHRNLGEGEMVSFTGAGLIHPTIFIH